MSVDILKREFKIFQKDFFDLLKTENELPSFLIDYLKSSSGKRIRPILGRLFVKSCGKNLNKNQKRLLLAVELIHNASLIHDDVIDNSEIRRGEKSLNTKFDNSLAISCGDLLLSVAMKELVKITSSNVREYCTKLISEICLGEIDQYFCKNKIPSINEYLEKSRKKTALLFEIAVVGVAKLMRETKFEKIAQEFSKNFGIAFQLKNDLIDIQTKKEDYKDGIYTAAVIYENEFSGKITQELSECTIEKSKSLTDNYLDRAIKALNKLESNQFRDVLIDFTKQLKEKK